MSKAKKEEFVFDGDSDSGDEDIEGFNQQVKKLEPTISDDDGEKKGGEDSSDDEVDDEEEDDMDDDSDSSEEEEDGDAKQKTLNTHLEKQSQISKLHEKLSAMDKDEQSDESEDDESEDIEDESDDNEDSAEEDSDDEDKEKIDDSPPKDIVKKKKVVENVEDDVKKLKGDFIEEVSDKRQKFKNKLSKMSIEDIQNLKNKIGLKLFNQSLGVVTKPAGSKMDYKRENKNRPREMSSKKTVGRFREVVTVAKAESKRDPRFDPLCGDYDEKLFKDSYKFVSNIKNDELNQLKKQLGEEQDPERKEKIKFLITRMKNQARQEKQNEARSEERQIETKKTKELLMAGKKPFIMGKAKQKEFDLAAKYEKLKESGGLDNYIKKQTKKNATKDRKKLEKLQ